MKETIYEKAIKSMNAGDVDHHESDLYLKFNSESSKLVEEYEFKENVTLFTSPRDGALWYEIPFAYTPHWEEKMYI